MILVLTSEGERIHYGRRRNRFENGAQSVRSVGHGSSVSLTRNSAGELAVLDPEIAQLVHHFRAPKARGKPLQGTRLLLARHAETAAPDRFHGAESDIGLSKAGVRQAELLGEWLKSALAAAVYSSAMRRAVDTAAPIALACG